MKWRIEVENKPIDIFGLEPAELTPPKRKLFIDDKRVYGKPAQLVFKLLYIATDEYLSRVEQLMKQDAR